MWNPFRRVKIEPILVADAEPAPMTNERIGREIERETLRSLSERHRVRSLADQIHVQLAAGALRELRGGEP